MIAKTYLGFDYGTKKIGIAVGQSVTNTARDLETIPNKAASDPNWSEISELIQEWQPEGLVVGVPLNSDNEETNMSRCAREFSDALSKRYRLPVYCVNEYLTTHAALDDLRGTRKHRHDYHDQVAAKLILETFLNINNKT